MKRVTITLAIVLGVVFTILCFNPLTAKSVIPTTKQSPVVKQYAKLGLSYNQIMYKLERFFQMERGEDIEGLPQYLGMTKRYGTVCIQIVGEKDDVSFVRFIVLLQNASEKQIGENDILIKHFLKNISPASVWTGVSQWYTNTLSGLNKSIDYVGKLAIGNFEVEMFVEQKVSGIVIMVHKRMP